MDIALTVEVLLLDAEDALHLSGLVHAVPERPVMGLEGVAGPGAPARKFALGFDMHIGAEVECVLGKLVHEKWPSIAIWRP